MTNPLPLQILGKNFTVKEFPSIGQLMEIEAMKNSLSKGQYHRMVQSNLKTTLFTLSLIDAVATFSVLLGTEFIKFTSEMAGEGKTLYDLPGMSAKELVRVYDKEFLPWYNGFMKDLYLEEEAEEGKKGESKKEGN